MVNDSSVFETLSYTSILPTGPSSAVITYNKFDYSLIGKVRLNHPTPALSTTAHVTPMLTFTYTTTNTTTTVDTDTATTATIATHCHYHCHCHCHYHCHCYHCHHS